MLESCLDRAEPIEYVAWLTRVLRGLSCDRSEDDLTHKLAEIIKANNRLKRQDQNGSPQHIIREFSQLLQFHITTYFDNTKPGQPVAAQVGKSGCSVVYAWQRSVMGSVYIVTMSTQFLQCCNSPVVCLLCICQLLNVAFDRYLAVIPT